jgi:hypothetical protein
MFNEFVLIISMNIVMNFLKIYEISKIKMIVCNLLIFVRMIAHLTLKTFIVLDQDDGEDRSMLLGTSK